MIYCGIDGGGTKTRIVIANDSEVLYALTAGPSSIDTVSKEVTITIIKTLLMKIYNEINIPKIDSIFLGIGGIASKEQSSTINELVLKLPFFKKDVVINSENDIMNAYLASCSGRNNITIIVGTGAVAYGVDESNKSHRTNGIHYLEGDFGGAYDVGKRALKKMSLAFDSRIEHTGLTTHLLEKFGIKTFPEIVKFFDTYIDDRTYIAQISKIVTKFSSLNDKYAIEILDEATDEMLQSIIGVDKKINLVNREIGVVGSLGNSKEYFELLKEKVIKYDNNIFIHHSELDPVEGSLIAARIQLKS